MTGLLSVNNITEFVYLVEQIINASLYRNKNIKNPSVVELVGPSGSGRQRSQTACAPWSSLRIRKHTVPSPEISTGT